MPIRHDTARPNDNRHLSLTWDLLIRKIALVKGGYARTVIATPSAVPIVAPPNRLWSTNLLGPCAPSTRRMIGISMSGNIEPTINAGKLNF